MVIREVVPAGEKRTPRVEHVAILLHVLGIDWLKDRGPLEIRNDGIYANDKLIATVERG